MTSTGWYSQPYPPEGASAAEGLRNQLGRPELDLLTILVRESAQNSWDARIADGVPVDYRIDIGTVGPAHTNVWRELLLAGAPAGSQDRFPLAELLRRGPMRTLSVSDRGTRGLGGPTRADDAVGTERDFVSFVRNVGEPRDNALGGGTYGFGKGIFYLLSGAGTILVHTRCRTADGGYQTRLIGCTLWKSYVARNGTEETRHTGRHWWGDLSGPVVEPLVGAVADETARRLGLGAFGPEETGTTVVVLAPQLDGQAAADAADYLAETISWHLWPKMLPRGGAGPAGPPMRFSVVCDGIDHPVPDPRRTRPLDMFVKAYEAMVGGGEELRCGNPKRFLGRLGLVKRLVPPLEPTRAARLVDVETLVHHVCLMRPAELVVTYWAGPKPPTENWGYAGVFRADETMDEIYAKAEPPTHDAWNPHSLERPESTFVTTTFARIRENVQELLNLTGLARPGAAHVALGAASSMFSGLVGGAWGIGGATDYGRPGATELPPERDGADDPGAKPSPLARKGKSAEAGAARSTAGSGRPRPRVHYVGAPYYDDRGETEYLVQEFRLPAEGPQRVRVELAVSLPGIGVRETEPPLGAVVPQLHGWEDTSGEQHRAETCVIEGGDDVWRVLVVPAPDTMTEIAVKVEAVKGA